MMEQAGGQAREELVYNLSRTSWLDGWWAWAIAVSLLIGGVYLMVRLYRRDTVDLATGTRASLVLLRLAVIVGLVVFLLGIERRARQRVTRPSEVAVLVDTSQSMSLPQSDQAGGATRMETAREFVSRSPVLGELARSHRLSVYTFDTTGDISEVLVSNLQADAPETGQPEASLAVDGQVAGPSSWAITGAVMLVLAALCMVAATVLMWFQHGRVGPQVLLVSVLLLIAGGGLLGTIWTRHTEQTLATLLGLSSEVDRSAAESDPADQDQDLRNETFPRRREAVDWDSVLVAAGAESRIGDALKSTLSRHDPSTLAGMLLLTDGQNNGGAPPIAVAALVSRGGTAIYPLGFGSAKPPVNVRIVDLDAPRRVYPGDKFALSAVLQGSGTGPMDVQVQLLDKADSGDAEGDDPSVAAEDANPGEVVDSREVTIPSDGTLVGVQFEMEPEAVGRRQLTVRVVPPADDQNAQDNTRRARYEVVSRRLRTLLVAGGPMREYRFVRNLLYRDESVQVDVWLQTGQPGISQDADEILTDFPSTAEALFEYDAILAFDPDWTLFDGAQLELIDQWLSRQAGGLVLISGPVYLPEWTRQRTDPRIDTVRDFYPVRLPTRGPLLSAGRTGGETAWPLEFAPDAARADFLRIDDDDLRTAEGWEQFGGVYDFVGVQEAKPGAKVYAYFSDPSAAIDEALPIYLASQFYGAGRVFFQGSGEMWRLRGVSVDFFDAYYTKLIRWVSEGRLLRDSNRGILLVDRPRAMVGDTVTVRAILTDRQFQPLRVPMVEAKLLTPSGRIDSVRLTPLQGEPREGTYTGRFLVREPGEFELRVTLGDALNEEILRQPVQASLPMLELERPRRNDDLLRAVAATTGGAYLPMDGETEGGSASNLTDPSVLAASIEPQPQLTILPGTPDRDFEQRRNASLMWLLCAMLTMEWMTRRLNRLA